jgi:hypothetical protein
LFARGCALPHSASKVIGIKSNQQIGITTYSSMGSYKNILEVDAAAHDKLLASV